VISPDERILVAGSGSLAGHALCRRLQAAGFGNVVAAELADAADLRTAQTIADLFARAKPEYVFVTAGRTAGIAGNQRWPADLMVDNLLKSTAILQAAFESGVKKLVYVASSCTYPKAAAQPMAVGSLWTGPLEPTSAPYAVAKLSGIKLCEAFREQHGVQFIPAISGDAYGPGDDFSDTGSHVVAALLKRMHDARIGDEPHVTIWGSGAPRREFIYADDLADACIHLMRCYDGREPINIGTGADSSIAELASLVRAVVGYRGELRFDRDRPDGMPFKALDSQPLRALGWRPSWTLEEGLRHTYQWFLSGDSDASSPR
jgi:GDP-L-fucose synthase